MTKEVLVSVAGLQLDIDSDNVIEVISQGKYYFKNNKHYIIYKEFDENIPNNVTKNTIKISPSHIDISKRGVNSVNMIFEEGKETMSYYETPFGSLLIGINTSKISVDTSDNNIEAKINYILSVNYTQVSECDITIKVSSN